MSKGDSRALYDKFTAQILEQQGFRIEDAPRSIYEPEQLYTALEKYATNWDDFEFIDSNLHFGFRMAYKLFAKPSDQKPQDILSDSQVISRALKMSKSAGLPTMGKKEDDILYGFNRELQIRQGLKAPNPCVAFKRTQKNNKTRLVWGYPLEMTIMEARFARPLIEQFKRRRTPMAFGLMKGTLGAHIHRRIVDPTGTIVALDYSKFDSTISKSMIKQAFRILSTWFEHDDLEEYGWDTLIKYFITTPIVMPDGHLYTGKNHGVPSGSYFTQIIDSIVNVALCFSLARRFDFQLDWKSLFVLGDDVLMNVNGQVDLNEWKQYLSQYGLKINVDKTLLDEPHFLGAYWYKGKPTASIQELVNKAVQPESYRDYQGEPWAGAQMVLESYARNYLNAIHMLPWKLPANMAAIDKTSVLAPTRWMSGSDRYLAEEAELGNNDRLVNSKSRETLLSTTLLR